MGKCKTGLILPGGLHLSNGFGLREKNWGACGVQGFGKGKKGDSSGLAGRERWDAQKLLARHFG